MKHLVDNERDAVLIRRRERCNLTEPGCTAFPIEFIDLVVAGNGT